MGMHSDMPELLSLLHFLLSGPQTHSLLLSQTTSGVQPSLGNFWADMLLEKLFGDLNWQKLSV